MPDGLGHPNTGLEHAIQGDLLGLGGDGVAGKDRLGYPSTQYIYVGGIWVPAGSVPLTTVDSWTLLIAEKLAAILEATEDNTDTVESVLARAAQRQEVGVPERGVARTYFPDDQVQVADEGVGHVSSLANYQGIPYIHDFGTLAALGFRKVVAVDGGAYTSPAAGGTQVTYTGLDLLGLISPSVFNLDDKTWHDVSNVVNPAGANPGTFDLTPPVRSGTPTLVIPYASVPHSYSTLADADRVDRVNPEWAHMVEPNRVLYLANGSEAGAPTTYHTYVNVVDYKIITVQIWWQRGGANTYQWDILGRLDDAAPAAGTWTNINAWFTVAGAALGGAAVGPLTTFAHLTRDIKMYEIDIQRVATGAGANNDNYEVWVTLA
jgi:hypothetical protein